MTKGPDLRRRWCDVTIPKTEYPLSLCAVTSCLGSFVLEHLATILSVLELELQFGMNCGSLK